MRIDTQLAGFLKRGISMLACKDCQLSAQTEYGGIYNFICKTCRNRFLIDEPCKMYRKVMYEMIRKWGVADDYEKEPHCECEHQCERMRTIRNATLNS